MMDLRVNPSPEHAFIPKANVLVVDDDPGNRQLLAEYLRLDGHAVTMAANGLEAMLVLADKGFDLVLLDLEMPELDGFGVLSQMKSNLNLRRIPVIIISATVELDSVLRGIEMGAEDHLAKPFNRQLLRTRMNACLARKRWLDQEQFYLNQIQFERDRAERLLLNVLPRPMADRLKLGETTIADFHPEVSVLFADLVGFTNLSQHVSPTEIVRILNEIFTCFDLLAARHGVEKIKTIGDCYMVAGGLPEPRHDHARAIALMALDMRAEMDRFNESYQTSLRMRIGINSGPVVAGIIGRSKFIYDLWGDTVNTASRMESRSLPGEIQVSSATYELLKGDFHFERRRPIVVKGKGRMITYLLKSIRLPAG